MMKDKQTIKTLNRLHRICKAGQRGFRTVAANVRNRGLKIIFRTHAQQRGQCAAELREEIERLGGTVSERRSIRGVIHRGRIDIVATMTIQEEKTEQAILKEAVLGEEGAIRAYQSALDKDLPSQIHTLIQEQYEKILAASEQIQLLQGMPGDRVVVQLFDNDREVEQAIQLLQEAGFSREAIETTALSETEELHGGKGSTADETILSGALGGAIWGSVLGVASGAGVFLVPGLTPVFADTVSGMWALIALSGILFGALIGAFLGFVIKVGLSEEDAYVFEQRIPQDSRLLKLQTTRRRASEASKIMNRIEKSAAPAMNAA
jgi:uncharacterized protein (TIGR02284 family)